MYSMLISSFKQKKKKFLLGLIYTRKNKFTSNKSVIASLSNSLSDGAMNLGDDYEDAPSNIEITNQDSINKDKHSILF